MPYTELSTMPPVLQVSFLQQIHGPGNFQSGDDPNISKVSKESKD